MKNYFIRRNGEFLKKTFTDKQLALKYCTEPGDELLSFDEFFTKSLVEYLYENGYLTKEAKIF